MSVKPETRSKFLEYAAGFFLLMCFAMSFSRWVQGVEFFPKWLIALFFVLFLAAFVWGGKLKAGAIKPPEPAPPQPKDMKTSQANLEEIWRSEREAHDLVAKICESKNIALRLKQEGRSGHCEIPEIWTIEKAVPLTPEEFYAIAVNGALHVDKEIGDDGIIYAVKFTRGGGWVVYEREAEGGAG